MTQLTTIKLHDSIIAETDDYVALNKPSGLLSIPDREGKEISLKIVLKEKYGNIFTVHRLDKDTSGLIVFAKNETAHKFLSMQFESRQTTKIYHGLVTGEPHEKSGMIEAPIMEHPAKNGTMIIHRNGKESITAYETLESFSAYSWMRFQIYTGRTHQVRVHARHLGHPIVCDTVYGDGKPLLLSTLKHKKFKLSKNELEERPLLNRLALHASLLSFQTQQGSVVELVAPLPKDLKAVLQQLNKWSSK